MNNKDKVEKLAQIICGKNVVYDKRYSISQTKKTICAINSYTEALHEIAHWIACDPDYRYETNLGLPFGNVEEEDPIHDRMYLEECVATMLTKMLFDKYFLNEENKNSTEYEFMLYLDDYSNRVSSLFKITPDMIKSKAINLFEEFTKNITL
jgi:hypothetical protein